MNPHLRSPLALLIVLLGAGCLGGPATEGGTWGVGENPGCDASAEHCWPEQDRASLSSVHNDVNEIVGVPEAERSFRLRTALGRARELSHKMTADELAAVEEIELRLASGAPEMTDDDAARTAGEINLRVIGRLEQGMMQAQFVPIEQDLQAIADGGLACDQPGVACAGEGMLDLVTIPAHYPQGMQDALRMFQSSGLYGKTVVGLLLKNGALDMDYKVENARLFGEYDERTQQIRDSGLSPAARVDRIVARARKLAGLAGVIAGGESLVPFAGIPLSLGHEELMLFEIHTKMAFRIAQVYGWDVQSGPALVNIITLIQEDALLLEGTDILLTNIAVPLIVRAIGSRFGYRTAGQIVSNLSGNAARRLFAMVSEKARRKLTQEVVEGGAKAVGRQIFGWVTFGATVAISGGADYYFTWQLGDRIKNAAQRWLGDLMHQGSTYLGNDAARECAFIVWSRAASVDGEIAPEERKLFQSYMANQYWVSETLHYGLSIREQTAHAATFKSIWDSRADADAMSDADDCLSSDFASADEQHRMVLLAYLYAMVNIDGDMTAAERDLYAGYRSELRGNVFRRIDEPLMDQIERSVVAEIRIPNTDIAREYGLTLEDVIPALVNAPPETLTAYAAAGAP